MSDKDDALIAAVAEGIERFGQGYGVDYIRRRHEARGAIAAMRKMEPPLERQLLTGNIVALHVWPSIAGWYVSVEIDGDGVQHAEATSIQDAIAIALGAETA